MSKKNTPIDPSELGKIYSAFDFDAHSLTPDEFAKKMKDKNAVVLDLRRASEFKKGHALGALNLEADASEERLEALIPSKEKMLLVYCANSFQMTRKLSLTATVVPQIHYLGYKNIYFLEDTKSFGGQAEEIQKKLSWHKN